MKVVIFEWVSLGGVDYYTAPKSEEDFSGEYVSLAEYQELNQQYQELADGSKVSILSLVEQRSQLRELLKRWNEYQWLFEDMNLYTSPELTQLIRDTQEVVE